MKIEVDMLNKLTSRKFWVAIAAFLASVSTSVAGLSIENEYVVIAGVVCGVLSAAIYQAAEAYVDAAAVSANGTSKVITATSNSANVVAQALSQGEASATNTNTKNQ